MGFQLSVAVGLMSLSALAALDAIARRPYGWQGSIAVQLLVLMVGVASLWWLAEWSGTIVAVTFALLVLSPRLLVGAARRQLLRGRNRAAVDCLRVASLLHPFDSLRFHTARVAATILVLLTLWMNVAMEFQLLQVGFAPYGSGFVVGLVIGSVSKEAPHSG